VKGKAMKYPLPDRRRCIAAIGDFIGIARERVSGALPQVKSSSMLRLTY
jgi:serine/threonine-protein kinase ATR